MKQPSLKTEKPLRFLTYSELESLNTKRLLGVLKSARAVEHDAILRKHLSGCCCEVCKEWILDPEEYDRIVMQPTAHLTAYKNRIKSVLATREHIQ